MSQHPRTAFRILGNDAIRAALPMADCIELMMQTMSAVARGEAQLPLRSVMPLSNEQNLLGIMPGALAEPAVFGAKLVCLFPQNPSRGLSSHTGVVVLFDPASGQLRALLDAAEITALRTAAASAAASRALARKDAGDLAILGTGEQALAHLTAMATVHRLRRVRVWVRSRGNAATFADRASSLCNLPVEVHGTVESSVHGADLICTTTASKDPILRGEWLSPGAHINLVGSSIPTTSEIDVEGVRRARYFVDHHASALALAGELKRAMEAGMVDADHIQGEIGDVHLGRRVGRRDGSDITIYKSLGSAAQDLAAAHAVYSAAERLGLGTWGNLSFSGRSHSDE